MFLVGEARVVSIKYQNNENYKNKNKKKIQVI